MEGSALQHQEPTRLVAPLLDLVVTNVWTSVQLAVAVAAAFLDLVRCTALQRQRRPRQPRTHMPVVPSDADLSDVPVSAHSDSDSGGESNATDDEEGATMTGGNSAASGFGGEAWRHGGFESAWDKPVMTTWEGLRLGFCADDGELERHCLLPLESAELAPVVRLWEQQGCSLDDGKGQAVAMQRRRRPTVKVVRFATGADRREGYVANSDE